ncbi:MAG: diguanylate cyclase [Pseudomonadota bacterium]
MKLIPLTVGQADKRRPTGEVLRLSLVAALGEGSEARLVLDAEGRVIDGNGAAADLAAALADAAGPAAKALREWAEDGYLGTLALTIAGPMAERRLTLSALPLLRENGAPAVMLFGREPDLASHLTQALAASRQLYKDLVACAGAMAWETDAQGRFSYVSGAEILGFAPLELMGEEAHRCLGIDRETAAAVFAAEERVIDVELWPCRKDGERACLTVSAAPVFDAEGHWRGARGMARDVSRDRAASDALAKARDTLARMALTDELTGLLNRRAFDDQVAVRIAHATRAGRQGALLMIDLDHFKAVNDSLGHAAGDAVLRALGGILEQVLRIGDLAARLGGDEFAVWLEDTDLAGAELLARRLLAQTDKLCHAPGASPCGVSLSIGIAPCEGSGVLLEGLKQRADEALYSAKRAGRNGYKMAEGA